MIGGEWWVALFALTAVSLGALAALALPMPMSIAAGALSPMLAIATLIAIKVVRWPSVPAVGDGFAAIPLILGGAGALTAILVRQTRGVARRTVAVLASLALVLAIVYALAGISGS